MVNCYKSWKAGDTHKDSIVISYSYPSSPYLWWLFLIIMVSLLSYIHKQAGFIPSGHQFQLPLDSAHYCPIHWLVPVEKHPENHMEVYGTQVDLHEVYFVQNQDLVQVHVSWRIPPLINEELITMFHTEQVSETHFKTFLNSQFQ